jgi:Colicin immunity protein / pyocin immunity protein
MGQKLSRDEMLMLVGRIFRAEGTEQEADADIELFVANCAHPSGTDLIFWPELVPELRGRVPTVEEVVDLAMRGGGG